MILLAAHRAAHSGFDLSAWLPFAVPFLLLCPLLAFVAIVSTFRTRRTALNSALFFVLIALVLGAVALAAQARTATSYTATYQWINLPLSFTGPAQFQGFGIDIVLRLDHVALLGLLTVLLLTGAALVWSRSGGRGEVGPVRLYALLCVALFAALGVILAADLAELLAFWALAGAASFLMLANRWGSEEPARSARLALSLPFTADLALLAAVSLLYSRYGRLDMDHLFPALHLTPGWGLKSLSTAGILIAIAAAGRAGAFPWTRWLAGNVGASPWALAFVQGIWTLLPALLVYRTLPIFRAAGPQATEALVLIGLIGGLLAAATGLVGADIRRLVTAAGAGQASIALAVLGGPVPVAGLLGAASGSLARAAGVLAAGSLVNVIRSGELTHMGQGWARLRWTSLAVLVAGSGTILAAVLASAAGVPRTWQGLLLGAALVVIAVAALRAHLGSAYGVLPRRRSFDPERVRELPAAMAGSAVLVGAAALVLSLAALFPQTQRFFEAHPRHQFQPPSVLLWVVVAAVGVVLAAVAFGGRRAAATRASRQVALALHGARLRLRFGSARWRTGVGSALELLETRVLAGGERELGRGLEWGARGGSLRVPVVAGLLLALGVAAVIWAWVRGSLPA